MSTSQIDPRGPQFTAALTAVVLAVVLVVAPSPVGVVLLAVRGYMGSGDRAVTGVLIFVAFAAVAIQAIEYFLAP